MKRYRTFWYVVGLVLSFVIGVVWGAELTKGAVGSGPYSDDHRQARWAIAEAQERLRQGDTNVFEQLKLADHHLRNAQDWTDRFLRVKNREQ